MNEWWLISVLIGMTVVAIISITYPLKRHPKVVMVLAPLILGMVFIGYYCWGGFLEWRQFIYKNNSQVLAQQLLKSIKTPQELIDKLKMKLQDNPQSAKGWYYLGRLYSGQYDNQNALKAFARAYQLEPQEEQFAVNYGHSLWLVNNQQFNPEIIGIFNTLLEKNPNQADALSMLAMNAFVSHAYEDAIGYWQRLLKIAPQHSEEALAIRKAIAKAQERLK